MTRMSSSNISREAYMELILYEINAQEVTTLYPLIVFYSLVLCLGVFGNALVLIVYSYRFKRSPARVYIIFLAAIDFSICCFGLPYHLIDLTNPYTYTNAFACKFLTFIMTTLFHMSIFGLIVIAIDRYLKICKPLGKIQIAYYGKRRACFTAFIAAILLSWPNLILYGKSEMESNVTNITGHACFFSTSYLDSNYPLIYIMTTMCVCIGSTVFLIITYAMICHRICTRYQKEGMSFRGSVCVNNDSEYTQVELNKVRRGKNENETNLEETEIENKELTTENTDDGTDISDEDDDIIINKHAVLSYCDNDCDMNPKTDTCYNEKSDQTPYPEKSPFTSKGNSITDYLHVVEKSTKDNANMRNLICTFNTKSEKISATIQKSDIENIHYSNEDLMKCVVNSKTKGADRHSYHSRHYGSSQNFPSNILNKCKSLKSSSKSQSMRLFQNGNKGKTNTNNATFDLRRELLTGQTFGNEGMRIHSRHSTGSVRSTMDQAEMDHAPPGKQHSKITRIMLTVTIVFILSYAPALVVTIWTSVQPEFWDLLTSNETVLCEFFLRFYLINNICNPFIYGFWDKRFKREIVYTFRKLCVGIISTCHKCCCYFRNK